MEYKENFIIDDNFSQNFFQNGKFLNENIFSSKTKEDVLVLKTHGKGPINIALIKYWGKEDENEIIPLNNSISVTLDMEKYFTDTYAELILDDKNQQLLYLNGEKYKITSRVYKVINYLRENAENIFFKNQGSNEEIIITKEKLQKGSLRIISRNTFPTAAGCASSASSMSILMRVISSLFNYKNNQLIEKDLSALARQGSGSACRSIYGGFSEWISKSNDELKSYAVSLADENHWKEFNINLLIVSDKKKDKGSTDGMKMSKSTSFFLKSRVENILPERLNLMRNAINLKDFSIVAELTIKDSNNLHAVCRDTFPTINYLNETSDFLIRCVEDINEFFLVENINENIKKYKYICSYSFDAGPNCFIFYLDFFKEIIDFYFENILFTQFKDVIKEKESREKIIEIFEKIEIFKTADQNKEMKVNLVEKFLNIILKSNEKKIKNQYIVKDIVSFKPGRGAYLTNSN